MCNICEAYGLFLMLFALVFFCLYCLLTWFQLSCFLIRIVLMNTSLSPSVAGFEPIFWPSLDILVA